MSALKQNFRCSFTTLVFWFIALLFLLEVLRILLFGKQDLNIIAWFQNMDLVVANAVVISAVIFIFLKSEVTAEGLTSYNKYGAMEFIKWENIKIAARKNFMGLGFYQIKANDGTCIYVPRYLRHQREFELLVDAIIDESNPLKQAFKT